MADLLGAALDGVLWLARLGCWLAHGAIPGFIVGRAIWLLVINPRSERSITWWAGGLVAVYVLAMTATMVHYTPDNELRWLDGMRHHAFPPSAVGVAR